VYQPAHHVLWDAWFTTEGDRYHAFYLQAPKPLPRPDARHDLAEVGHAVSPDLVTWEEQPAAFRAGPPGAWDDRSIFTGSVLRHDGQAHLFYTSTAHAEDGLVQRIGHATSPRADLRSFVRASNDPLLEVDPVWYETAGGPYEEVHWRDPWALVHGGRVHLFITARARRGPWDGRGTIALATSEDFIHWHIHPPVVVAGDFWLLEVPQVLYRQGRWWMIASTGPGWHSTRRLDRLGRDTTRGGIVVYSADHVCGPYTLARNDFVVGDRRGTHYTGKIVATPDGDVLVASRFLDRRGDFLGALTGPVPVRWREDGPVVDTAALAAQA
jgi:beta-fructofuranosidase